MGNSASQQLLASHSSLLERLSGPVSTAVNDSFWTDLFDISLSLTKLDPVEVEKFLLPICQKLERQVALDSLLTYYAVCKTVTNTSQTGHFHKLLWHLLQQLEAARTSDRGAQRTTNALYLVRVLVRVLTESLNAIQLCTFLDQTGDDVPAATESPSTSSMPDGPQLVEQVVRSLLTLVSTCRASAASYLLHLQALQLLLVMCSTQLYTPTAAAFPGEHPFTQVLMRQGALAPPLVQGLLQLYIERPPLPPRAPLWAAPDTQNTRFMRLVRSAAVSVMWLPLQAYSLLVRPGGPPVEAPSPLADSALLLLLVLLHHAPREHLNPFAAALQRLQDAEDTTAEAAEGGRSVVAAQACVSYAALYNALGRGCLHDTSVLLLYSLLHTCQPFQEYALVRSDVDTLLLPLLQALYGASQRSSAQLYMLLIVVLILTQDASFTRTLTALRVASVPWYRDRLLKGIPLASLLVVVLLRTAHYNLSKLRDVYLQTNTLAALANLAPQLSGMSSHAAQRLLSLLDMLSRRYHRLAAPVTGLHASPTADDPAAGERQVYGDFLRMVLEIINAIITNALRSNPQLVYVLLQRQELFGTLRGEPQLAELLDNIHLVISYFNSKVEEAKQQSQFEWSVESVLRVVQASMQGWRPDSLKQFPELRFSYEEEGTPEDFFVPLVWSLLVASNTAGPWHMEAIQLFQAVEGSSLPEGSARNDSLFSEQSVERYCMQPSSAADSPERARRASSAMK